MKPFKPYVAELRDYPYENIDVPVKLDQNENPFDLPRELLAGVFSRLGSLNINRYPEIRSQTLRKRLAAFEGWEAEGVVLAPGSNVLIQALAAAAQRVLDVEPSFAFYQGAAHIGDTPYQAVQLLPSFALPVKALIRVMAQADQPGVFFLPNPHAPTGTLFGLAEIDELAEAAAQHGWLMVIDEAYYQFAPHDCKRQVKDQPHMALLRTFSKAWGLAGLRAGYLLASPEVAGLVQRILSPFIFSSVTQVLLEEVLEHPGYVAEHAERIRRERERMYVELKAHPSWRAFPSAGNFLLIKTQDAGVAQQALLRRGVAIRRQDHLPGLDGCIRVTVGTVVENDAFLKAAFELGHSGAEEVDAGA